MRRILQVAAFVLTLGVGLSACQKGPETGSGEERPTKPAVQPQKGDKAPATVERVPLLGAKIKGSDKALVTIVEMSDYACPFCKKAHQTIEALLGEYGDKVRLAVFENPLPFHKTAEPAARWAFAAGEQGRFWEARDALFEHQKALDEDGLAAAAKELGLDAERLERDRKSVSADRYVRAGLDLAKSLGVKGTPTFFINGRRLIGAQPAATIRAAIDAALKDAEGLVAKGIRREDVYSKILETASLPGQGAEKPAGAKGDPDGEPCGAGEDCGCKDRAEAKEAENAAPVDVEIGAAPARGDATAPVTLVVFTDFECPFCAKAEATVRALEKAYPGKLRVVYKAAPLPFHEHARLAAKAALAAHRQGKFFEYRDAVFQHQDKLDRDALVAHAAALGLDVERFVTDLDQSSTEAAVAADEAQVKKLGVEGTPTFFVNGRKVIGAQPEDAFRREIDRALAERR